MEFQNINEAEKFLQQKASGKILSFTDYINESDNRFIYIETWYDNGKSQLLGSDGTKVLKSDIGDRALENAIKTHINSLKGMKKIKPSLFKDKVVLKVVNGSGKELKKREVDLNESLVNEETKVDGFGEQSFFFAKNGDSFNYLFKIHDGKDTIGFVISIGKFSKVTQPTEQKSDYSIISIMKLSDTQVDQAVLDGGTFDSNTENIIAEESLFSKILAQLSIILEDYLQHNPKVAVFYDEMQLLLQAPDYDNKFALSLTKWTGEWSFQTMEKGKLNIIKKD